MDNPKIPFIKPTKTIAQQIDHLIKRGMAIPDRELATRHLEHINYYRLSGYALLFERKKYSEQLPPIWATVEIMYFGQLSIGYKSIRHARIRQRIADVYQLDEKILSTFLHHLTIVRNICAHHGNLWNRNHAFRMKLPKKKPSILYPFFNINNPRKLYNTLVLIGYIMQIITNSDNWKKQIPKLMAKHPTIQIKNIGFPENWNDFNFWK